MGEEKSSKSDSEYKYSFGDKVRVWIFIAVALFIIACIIYYCVNPTEITWEEEQRQRYDEREGDYDPR